MIIITDFLPVYPDVAAHELVELVCVCPGVTEFCCGISMNVASLQRRGRGSSSSGPLAHRRGLSNLTDALKHATDAQVNKAREDGVTLRY